MRWHDRSVRLSVAIGVSLGHILLAASGYCRAEAPPVAFFRPLPAAVYVLGPSTAYAAAAHGNADFLRAVGSLRVDTAVARKIDADAYAKELENSVLQVRTYFERRLANQAYRRMLDPRAKYRQDPKSPGEALYEKVRKGDLYKEMNWLLLALFQQRMHDQAAFKEAVDQDSAADLEAATLRHLWFTDRAEHGACFRADEAIPLNEDWPALLQTPAFDQVRQEFVKARDDALEQIKKQGQKDPEQNANLQRAREKLADKFDQEYRPKLKEPGKVRLDDYFEAAKFVRLLRFQVDRFVRTNFQQDAYRFRGNRSAELVDFMGARGLYFDKPRPGDEGTYQAIFVTMQEMYERTLRWDRPIAQQ